MCHYYMFSLGVQFTSNLRWPHHWNVIGIVAGAIAPAACIRGLPQGESRRSGGNDHGSLAHIPAGDHI